jgi:hypothetical protein
MNPTRRSLFRKIDAMENADYDYVITIFSGHGEEAEDDTVLILNGQGEKIAMSALTNLSQRQLLIIDCCRSPMSRPLILLSQNQGQRCCPCPATRYAKRMKSGYRILSHKRSFCLLAMKTKERRTLHHTLIH